LDEEDWGLALRHPSVSMIPYCYSMGETANRWLVQKSERLEQAIEEKEWDLALVLHEKYARIAAFQELAPQMTDEEYWQHLRQTWMEVENLWQYRDLIPGLLAPPHRDKSHRHLMMDEAERRLLNGLPLECIIYRGCGPANEQGWSWTLSAEQAEWFAERSPGRNGGVVLEGECHRLDIIAFLDGRGEDEILIDPEDVRIVRRVDVTLDEDCFDD